MTAKKFALQADLEEMQVGFTQLSEHDEATQYPDPRIWTAQRDVAMREALGS